MTDTDTAPLVLSTAGPFTPEYVRRVAAQAAECVRVLNHASLSGEADDAFRFPSDADYVLCELATMTQRLPQLCRQLSVWLAGQAANGRIAVTYGEYEGHPEAAETLAEVRLGDAEKAAGDLYAALNAARQLTAAMSAPYDPSEDPDVQ